MPEDQRQRTKVLDVPGVEGDYAYRVRDEAMLPQLRPGDYVVVNKQEPNLGDLVLCLSETGLVQVRRMSRGDSGMLLLADNSAYGPATTDEKNTVLGRVCQVIRTFEM